MVVWVSLGKDLEYFEYIPKGHVARSGLGCGADANRIHVTWKQKEKGRKEALRKRAGDRREE